MELVLRLIISLIVIPQQAQKPLCLIVLSLYDLEQPHTDTHMADNFPYVDNPFLVERNRCNFALRHIESHNDLVDTIELNDLNDWSYDWRELSGDGNWQVLEASIPKGYTPSYKHKDGQVTITNTASLIQTGQLNWPIYVFGGLGILMVGIGIIISKQRTHEDV